MSTIGEKEYYEMRYFTAACAAKTSKTPKMTLAEIYANAIQGCPPLSRSPLSGANVSLLALFYFASILITDQCVGNKIFDELYNFRIINVPISIIDKISQQKLFATNKLRSSCCDILSQLINLTTTLVTYRNFTVVQECEFISDILNIIVQDQLQRMVRFLFIVDSNIQ